MGSQSTELAYEVATMGMLVYCVSGALRAKFPSVTGPQPVVVRDFLNSLHALCPVVVAAFFQTDGE